MSDEESVIRSLRFSEEISEKVELRVDQSHVWLFLYVSALVSMTAHPRRRTDLGTPTQAGDDGLSLAHFIIWHNYGLFETL